MFGAGKRTQRVWHFVTDRAAPAAEDASARVESAVNRALSRITPAQLPGLVHNLIIALTGNQKAAGKARRAIAAAVKRAARTLGPTQ